MDSFFAFIIGSIWGSFFGLVIDRLPHASIIHPRSHCSTCGQPLAYRDLIPILSQIMTRFRCRYCGVTLPYWYAGLESLTGCLFMLAWLDRLDLTTSLICLASCLLVSFDLKSHAFPFLVWVIFFLLLTLTCPVNPLVYGCVILAYLTEQFAFKMGSGDWLYLSLLSFSLTFHQLTLCLFLASLTGITYFALKRQEKKVELPFLPFLFLSYLLILYFIRPSGS